MDTKDDDEIIQKAARKTFVNLKRLGTKKHVPARPALFLATQGTRWQVTDKTVVMEGQRMESCKVPDQRGADRKSGKAGLRRSWHLTRDEAPVA
jgi:hypothetical protein